MTQKFYTKVSCLFLFFWITSWAFGQDFYENNISTNDPVYIPSSPEAANLGRFGNLPLNSSTGQMNYAIPLHTIATGNYSWPISLQYNYSGFVLEGKPSLMGLGWNLQANGAVIRQIRGIPDEHANGYYGLNGTVKSIIDDFETTGDMSLSNLREKFFKGVYDSEVDKYTVNVNGINFSFKIDENGNPIYLSRHNYIVDIEWNQNFGYTNQIDSFTVLDDQGIKYTFSYIERSIPYLDEEINLNPITSWNIEKVEYPNGKDIQFQYTSDNFVSYGFSARGAVLLTDVQGDLTNNPVFFSPVYKEFASVTTVNRRLLTKITFNGGYIDFNLASNTPRKLYQSIVVKDKNGQTINDYIFSHEGERDFLTTITKNQEHFYGFEYHGFSSSNNSVPDFMQSTTDKPLAQDRWKYYNGASNSFALNVPASSYTADLEPNFFSTRVGAIKKIIYPTRGFTEVRYGQNQIKTNNIFKGANLGSIPLDKTFRATLQLDGTPVTSQYKEVITTHTFNNPTVATISHFATTNDIDNTHLFIRIERIASACPYEEYYPAEMLPLPLSTQGNYHVLAPYLRQELQTRDYEDINSEIPVLCPALNFEWTPAGVGGAPTSELGDSRGRVIIPPGTYEIKIFTDFNGHSEAYGEVEIKYNSDQGEGTPTEYVNENVGGIRVVELKDCPNMGDCNSRYFDYNDDDGLSTGILNVVPVRQVISSWETTYSENSFITKTFVELYDYSTNAYTALSPDMGTPVYYESVKESNSVEKYNGYKQSLYEAPMDISSFDYPSYPKTVDLDKGRLKGEKFYKFLSYEFNPILGNSTEVELIQENKMKYTPFRGLYYDGMDGNVLHPLSFKVVRKQNLSIDFNRYSYDLNPFGPEEIQAVKNLYQIVSYKELDQLHKIQSQESMLIYPEGNTTQKTTYSYDADGYRQLRKQTSTDSSGKSLEIEFEYAYDHLTEGVHQDMIDANQLTNPVKIFKTENGASISKQEVDYKLSGAEYKPSIVHNAKGEESSEAKIVYDYDIYGNVKEVLLPNASSPTTSIDSEGRRTSYIFGYNNMLPIAKLENISRSEIEVHVGQLQVLSNADNDRTKGYLGKEGELREALDNLRTAFPDALVTTYTYDPLIGVTSTTDARGYTTYYEYDSLNRLLNVKDKSSKLIKEFVYGYRADDYVDPDGGGSFASMNGSLQGESSVSLGEQINFTALVTGGSQNFTYSWYKDGNPLLGANISQQVSFDTPGTTTVSVIVEDIETGLTLDLDEVIQVYDNLSDFTLTANPPMALAGDNINVTSSPITGGSGSLSYEWYIDTNLQSFNEVTNFNYQFNTAGTYAVKLVVTDENTDEVKESIASIGVFEDLLQPTLSANEDHIVEGGQITFTPTNFGGGGIVVYEWYVDGVKLTTSQTSPYTHQFDTEGDYEIIFIAKNNALNISKQASVTVHVHQNLNVGSISPASIEIPINRPVTFTVPTITGGSTNKTYQWLIGATEVSTNATNFTYSNFSSAGDYTVRFKVTDHDLNTSDESSVLVKVHSPLTVPTVSSLNYVTTNSNPLYITTGNIGGGSGSLIYEWYVTFNGGSEQLISGQTSTTINYSGFNTAGTYEFKFKVIDTNIDNHSAEKTKTVEAYAPIVLNDNDITTPSPITVNSNTYFNVATAIGGSGSYEYEWDIISEHTPPNTHGFDNRSEANKNVSSFQMTYDYYGTTTIQCRVHDLITGEYSTASKQVIVDGSPPLSSFLLLNTDTDAAPDSGAYRITAGGVSGGSGDPANYEYTFYVNNTEVQKSSSNIYEYVILNCNQSGANSSATVRCDVRDILTGDTSTQTSTIDLDYNCNGGGNQ